MGEATSIIIPAFTAWMDRQAAKQAATPPPPAMQSPWPAHDERRAQPLSAMESAYRELYTAFKYGNGL